MRESDVRNAEDAARFLTEEVLNKRAFPVDHDKGIVLIKLNGTWYELRARKASAGSGTRGGYDRYRIFVDGHRIDYRYDLETGIWEVRIPGTQEKATGHATTSGAAAKAVRQLIETGERQ